MLKRICIVLCILCIYNSANAKAVYVKPHITKNGTFVSGHYRTKPNKTKLDNFSNKGNYNPYSLKDKTVEPNNIKIKY